MAAQQQQSQGDNSLAPLWIAVGVFLLLIGIWYFAQPQIVGFVLHVRLAEIALIRLFTSGLDPLNKLIFNIPYSEYGNIGIDQLMNISNQVGMYLRYPIVAILFILAVILYLSNPTLRFKKIYSIQSLAEQEKINWPQITPVVRLDLIDEDINKGPWAMSLTPMQFAKKYDLLRVEQPKEVSSFNERNKIIATVIRERAHNIFTLQLSSYWAGVEHLRPHTRALFAVFSAKIVGDREGATKILNQISRSSESGKLDFSGVDALLRKHHNNKNIVKIIQNHAYVLTVMASMLAAARGDGVLAAADFLWLRPVDRTLWYMLNNVGRQTAFVEIGGPFAHWLAELEVGHRLYVPMVEEAVNALDKAIQDILYVPDDVDQ